MKVSRKISIWFAVAVFGLICLLAYRFILRTDRPIASLSHKSISPNTAAEETSDLIQIVQTQKEFVYPMDNRREPFHRWAGGRNEASEKVETPHTLETIEDTLLLTGIIWKPGNPAAIVADSAGKTHLVKSGDTIEGTQVVSVNQKGIIIQRDGKRQEILVWPDEMEGKLRVER